MRFVSALLLPLLVGLVSAITGCSPEKAEKKDATSQDIYTSYKSKGVGNLFSVPPGLATIFLDDTQKGNAEIKELLREVNNLTFFVVPNVSKTKESEYYTDINARLNDILFRDLATVNSGKEIVNVKVLATDTANVSEIVFLVSNCETLFCVSFRGDISLQKIVNLTQPENLAAVSHLNRFKR